MFESGLTTYTGSIVSRLDDWQQQPKASKGIVERLRPDRLIGIGGTFVCASVESLLNGLRFIVLLAPLIVKKAAEVLAIQRLAHLLAPVTWDVVRSSAHKAAALGLHAIIGSGLAAFDPAKSVGFFDGLGLERERRFSVMSPLQPLIASHEAQRFYKDCERYYIQARTVVRDVGADALALMKENPQAVSGTAAALGLYLIWGYLPRPRLEWPGEVPLDMPTQASMPFTGADSPVPQFVPPVMTGSFVPPASAAQAGSFIPQDTLDKVFIPLPATENVSDLVASIAGGPVLAAGENAAAAITATNAAAPMGGVSELPVDNGLDFSWKDRWTEMTWIVKPTSTPAGEQCPLISDIIQEAIWSQIEAVKKRVWSECALAWEQCTLSNVLWGTWSYVKGIAVIGSIYAYDWKWLKPLGAAITPPFGKCQRKIVARWRRTPLGRTDPALFEDVNRLVKVRAAEAKEGTLKVFDLDHALTRARAVSLDPERTGWSEFEEAVQKLRKHAQSKGWDTARGKFRHASTSAARLILTAEGGGSIALKEIVQEIQQAEAIIGKAPTKKDRSELNSKIVKLREMASFFDIMEKGLAIESQDNIDVRQVKAWLAQAEKVKAPSSHGQETLQHRVTQVRSRLTAGSKLTSPDKRQEMNQPSASLVMSVKDAKTAKTSKSRCPSLCGPKKPKPAKATA